MPAENPSQAPKQGADLARVPVFLATGFRPFFLLAALSAIVLPLIWVCSYLGYFELPTMLDGVGWHAQSLIFGYTAAVLAGFLLTAVRNWTQRPTLSGAGLGFLAIVWIAGRVLVAISVWIPAWIWVTVDVAFFVLLAAAIARPIFGARNRRNYAFPFLVLVMGAGALLLDLDSVGALEGQRPRGIDLGLYAALTMIAIVGGRIIPAFTRNKLKPLPIRANGSAIDKLALASIVVALCAKAIVLPQVWMGVILIIAGLINLARMTGWGTSDALSVPLLAILHVGYWWLAVGLILRGIGYLTPAIPRGAGIHALTIGCIGMLTLGMLVRVALGHTGRKLKAPPIALAAFAMLTLAVLIRVTVAVTNPNGYQTGLWVSSVLWALAFIAYIVGFTRILVSSRPDGKPG